MSRTPPQSKNDERRSGGEQEREPERITIKRGGARDVLAHDGDLADSGLREVLHGGSYC